MMNPFCTCPAAGWCDRHKKNKGPQQFSYCKGAVSANDCDKAKAYWEKWETGGCGATAPADPILNPPGFCGDPNKIEPPKPRSSVGTVLKGLIRSRYGIEIPCQECAQWIEDLNSRTPEECQDVREELVASMVGRIQQQALPLWMKIAARVDSMLDTGVARRAIEELVDIAIQGGRLPGEGKKKVVAGNPLKAMRITSEQQSLANAAAAAKPPEQDPWQDGPVFHFGAHLWPTIIDGKYPWLWHVARWNELVEQINGRAFVVVAVDDDTATFDAVRLLLHPKIEVVPARNNAQGENDSFDMIQRLTPKGPDDVLLYCHGKGVRKHTHALESVKIWSELMYETVIFNFDGITQRLAEGYKTFGSFRTFGSVPLEVRNKWHYSGTFFAVRAKYLGKYVKSGYGGVEVWPGEHFKAAECWNEFADNRPLKAQYDINFLYPKVIDEGMQWEVSRMGGPRCEQHKRELDWFLRFLNPHDKILVIGSKHGGLEHQIRKRYPAVAIVSCDIAPQRDNKEFVIVGDSSKEEIQIEIRKHGPYDVVFIDGDHSYAGVKKDWEFVRTLEPRVVAFHDIAYAKKHYEEGCFVDQLWGEIRSTQEYTHEKIVGCGWGGIGVVLNPS